MGRFVKIADKGSTCDFINLDQVTMVQCSVRRLGGGVDIESIGEGKAMTSTPARTLAIITLSTANGIGEMQFGEFAEAEEWLQESFDLSVSFSQL